jgi:hypothetical protein
MIPPPFSEMVIDNVNNNENENAADDDSIGYRNCYNIEARALDFVTVSAHDDAKEVVQQQQHPMLVRWVSFRGAVETDTIPILVTAVEPSS